MPENEIPPAMPVDHYYAFRQLSEAKQKTTRYAGARQEVVHKKPHFR
jgi:hypothetical protein